MLGLSESLKINFHQPDLITNVVNSLLFDHVGGCWVEFQDEMSERISLIVGKYRENDLASFEHEIVNKLTSFISLVGRSCPLNSDSNASKLRGKIK